MYLKKFLVAFIIIFSLASNAQVCTTPGQTPATAFPVCGTSVFNQANVPICGNTKIPVPCNAAGSVFTDKNPYWYKFTCFKSGTLGFAITPKTLSDDYDWQLFDITGKNPNNVFSDASMFVACNWSGEGGITGASSAGTSLIVCEGFGKPLWSRMPNIVQGREYLLLVSHFTDSQSGYSLSFNGGTASITDTTPPRLLLAKAFCDGKRISIKLNKKMRCNSLAGNGSDFTISSPTNTVVAAFGVNCSNGFDMDSLEVDLANPLAPGSYTITIKKGTDNNTILDNCNAGIPEGSSLSFTVLPLLPTPMDSISPVKCKPNEIQLVFRKPMLCATVAPNGSDFTLTSPTGATIIGATTVCNNNVSSVIRLQLSSPIYTKGTHTITLKTGSDGNTILDECSQETPAGSTISFTTEDTVSAAFTYTITAGCKLDTARFFHDGRNSVNKWNWRFNPSATSTQQNPVFYFSKSGPQTVQLAVSNAVCTDTATVNFILADKTKADFTAPTFLCPNDLATFRDTSKGKIISWNWDFANGNTSTQQFPPSQAYPTVNIDRNFMVKLVVTDSMNCRDSITKPIRVLYNCLIAVPSAFTPNGDGKNDFLYPLNAYKAANLIFRVYNRMGQMIWETRDWTRKWDGNFNGQPQATGTFVWTLQYTNSDNGQQVFTKGTTVLIR